MSSDTNTEILDDPTIIEEHKNYIGKSPDNTNTESLDDVLPKEHHQDNFEVEYEDEPKNYECTECGKLYYRQYMSSVEDENEEPEKEALIECIDNKIFKKKIFPMDCINRIMSFIPKMPKKGICHYCDYYDHYDEDPNNHNDDSYDHYDDDDESHDDRMERMKDYYDR